MNNNQRGLVPPSVLVWGRNRAAANRFRGSTFTGGGRSQWGILDTALDLIGLRSPVVVALPGHETRANYREVLAQLVRQNGVLSHFDPFLMRFPDLATGRL